MLPSGIVPSIIKTTTNFIKKQPALRGRENSDVVNVDELVWEGVGENEDNEKRKILY